jgi:radical SAM protein with 4Fe4S-binding SPASM domain
VIDRYGPYKVSALPTVDPLNPPGCEELIESYVSFGLESIFLRPINYQGFARKRHKESREQGVAWRTYYERFVRAIIARNWSVRSRVLEETYFSICLRRVFQPRADRHVDLRNPNPLGVDYIVVDYDGTVFPTDEARMLSRSGVINLAIGDIFTGWDSEARDQLNAHSTNQFDPACQRCAFQPYCGRDLVDDIARYGRIDLPRFETEFCRKHRHIFDLVFQLIYENDPAVRYSLARWLRLPGTPAALGSTLA